jgi:hypothetical protein
VYANSTIEHKFWHQDLKHGNGDSEAKGDQRVFRLHDYNIIFWEPFFSNMLSHVNIIIIAIIKFTFNYMLLYILMVIFFINLLDNSSLSLASWTCLARKSFDPFETFEDFKSVTKRMVEKWKIRKQKTK